MSSVTSQHTTSWSIYHIWPWSFRMHSNYSCRFPHFTILNSHCITSFKFWQIFGIHIKMSFPIFHISMQPGLHNVWFNCGWFQQSFCCSQQCFGSTTHKSLCWWTNKIVSGSISIWQQSKIRIFSICVSFWEQHFGSFNSTFNSTIWLSESWTRRYMFKTPILTKFCEFSAVKLRTIVTFVFIRNTMSSKQLFQTRNCSECRLIIQNINFKEPWICIHSQWWDVLYLQTPTNH